MAFAYSDGAGGWAEILGPFRIGGRQYPYNWAELATAEEREDAGVAEIVETERPAGVRVTGYAIADDEGVPTRTWATEALPLDELAAARVAAVDVERDARIEGGFTYAGDLYQSRQSDRENVSTLGLQAQLAVLGGAEAGDLRWHGGPSDFVWILADNTTVPLDAPGMVALFQTGITFKHALTFAARAKKDWLLDPARTREELLAFDAAADWPA